MSKSKAPSGNAKARSGGGEGSRQHVRTPIKAGPANTKKISVSAAANQGLSKGNHAMNNGKTLQRPADPLVQKRVAQVPSGNAVALNVGRGGPGAGRVVNPCGSQGQHGPVNPGANSGSSALGGAGGGANRPIGAK